MTSPVRARPVSGRGVGASIERPDGGPKVRGTFSFASDVRVPGALWGMTLRSPHARASIIRLDVARALALPGVAAVLTAADIPGSKFCGLGGDQAVLALDEVSYWGQPVAIVAARDPETARRAVAAVDVAYAPLPAALDPVAAAERDEVFRELAWERGPDLRGAVIVEGYYEVGMQDQAPLGLESGIAIPDGHGGMDIHAISQWLHADRDQIANCLGVDQHDIRVHPAGVGGAFGAREDLSLQVHLALLAQRTRRPVRMAYDREESFAGHVHRHPARLWYRHEADTDGTLVRIDCTILLDGGAYASTSGFVIGTAAAWAAGPYRCPSVRLRGIVAQTNNPPAGAMRGFGAVQACIGYEAQMDRLAGALGMSPVALRIRNALRTGDRLSVTGQAYSGPLPVVRCLEAVAAMPLPDGGPSGDVRELPGGVGRCSASTAIRRGTGFAVGIKNAGFPEGFDDYSDARVVLRRDHLEVQTAAIEVGQGLVAVLQQIARSASGIDAVRVRFVSTDEIGSAGSSSASRQTQLSGGAVLAATKILVGRVLAHYLADRLDDRGVWRKDELMRRLEDVAGEIDPVAESRFRHPATTQPDEHGQGNLAADVMIAAHRAVVDVDVELGLVRVVEVSTAQDVGRAIHPQAVLGQIEGGIAQGVGLATTEELIVREGRIVNASFTDYLLPTFADAPQVRAVLIEEPSEWAPFGAKGVGEPPTVSSTAAVLAAIRDATGIAVWRTPVRPEDLVLAVRAPTPPPSPPRSSGGISA